MDRIANFMLSVIMSLGILAFFTVFFLTIYYFIDNNTPDDYNYIDLDGNAGSADYCGNGRYVLYCKDGDKIITVKEYSTKKEDK